MMRVKAALLISVWTSWSNSSIAFTVTTKKKLQNRPTLAVSSATTEPSLAPSDDIKASEARVLGSQELLMLPRQYSISKDVFPSMNHVSVVLLSQTPPTELLEQAVDYVMQSHPLLQSRVTGDGEPKKRIDLFQMVREGEPNPLAFSVDTKLSAKDVLRPVIVAPNADALEKSWADAFQRDLDDGSWCSCESGPLWKLEVHAIEDGPCALLFSFNHAISDQSSANRLTDQLLRRVTELENGNASPPVVNKMPVALEDSVLGMDQRWSDVQASGISPGTIKYVAGKAAEGLRDPVILPASTSKDDSNAVAGALSLISGQTAGGTDEDSKSRRSNVAFRSLSAEATSALLNECRSNGVSITNALTAAVTLTATDHVGQTDRNYKVLQSLDMRRFGAMLDKGETVACMAGSMDLMHGPLSENTGKSVRTGTGDKRIFWTLAKEGKKQTEDFVNSDGPKHAVRVFDFAMTIADLNNLVYLTAQSKDTQGRAYSAGVTNVGVYERQLGFASHLSQVNLQLTHGNYTVDGVYFATPHVQSGCLHLVSCMTVGSELKMTFNPVAPIVSEETTQQFADSFVELLEIIGGTIETKPIKVDDNKSSSLPSNILTVATAVVGTAAVASHAGAWKDFFASVMQMKDNVDDPADFWAALNFWIFFAVGHPILQPILWISDVLHGSPGPRIAELVPYTFVAGNIAAIWAIQKFKDLRNAVNIAAVAAFFSYVGAGLDGNGGLGDFNLALDDNYKGQVVKGCPAYEDVRQPSMNDFNIEKYQGLWYEHKFHDWTQFKEVYDTTLAIKLTEGGKGWVDDFGVRGPSPEAAKLSWDKSPVANGAHYFLFGRVDPNDPPGILREKGFGVEFPNYIVDVQKDPKTGEYTESIQFQCLERGGVRVFEGINFMSRKELMTEAEMNAMHTRAEQANMYPYGASPEQMHTVARRPSDAPPVDNAWQEMWRFVGVDKLLQLLTESIEDGGR